MLVLEEEAEEGRQGLTRGERVGEAGNRERKANRGRERGGA